MGLRRKQQLKLPADQAAKLQNWLAADGVGRHLPVVWQDGALEIKSAIEALVRACASESRDESMKLLARQFTREFEDQVSEPQPNGVVDLLKRI